MKKLIHEIHRRSLWQVLGVYLVTGWIILGVVGTLAESLNLPDWTPRFAFFLLIIGLPIVLATAFVQEGVGRPEATEERSPEDGSEPDRKIGRVHHRLFTWRNALVGGAAAFLVLFGFAGLYVVIQDRGRSFAPQEAIAEEADPGVAFLPFSVSGSALETIDLRESMVVLLSMALDGIEGIRPISPMTLWARWDEQVPEGGEADLETALRVAEETEARYAVVGKGVSLGSRVRLAATLYEVSSRTPLSQVEAEGSPDSLLSLVDRFAVETIRAIGGVSEGELSRIDLTSVTTESPEALKEFLRGEARYRRADWATALSHFERALDADSTFGAAHYRAAMTLSWASALGESGASQYHLEEALFLPGSVRVDVAIEGLLAAGSPPTTTDELDGVLEDLLAGVRRYPDDAELWNALGELYWHNYWRGALTDPLAQAEMAFTRASELVPGAAPLRFHLVHLAFWRADSALARERLGEFARLAPGSDVDRTNRIMWRTVFGGPQSTEELEAAVDTLEASGLRGAAFNEYAVHPSAWPIAEAIIRRRQATNPGRYDCDGPNRALGAGRLRFHIEEAMQEDGPDWLAPWCLRLAHIQGIAVPNIDSVLAASGLPYWIGLGAADGGRWTDFEAAVENMRDSASARLAAGDSAGAAGRERGVRVLEGYREWKREENPDRMLEILEGLPLSERDDVDSRWWLGMLYLEVDRPTDAIRMFETFWGGRWLWPIAKCRLGQAYEQLGDIEKARLSYSEFVEAWNDADPELQPWVEQGRAALRRLGPLDQ